MNSSTVVITINLPHDGGQLDDDYVRTALQLLARTYLDAGGDIEAAGCYGNWSSQVSHSVGAYQPTLWQQLA